MDIELSRLVEHFAGTLFRVKEVYRYAFEPGRQSNLLSAPYAGFIFPITGSAQLNFDNTPYLLSRGAVLHGAASVPMHNRVVGNETWEYICILYDVFDEPEGLALKKIHFDLQIGCSAMMYDYLYQLHETFLRPGAISEFQVEMLFRCLLNEMFMAALSQTKRGSEHLFESVCDYIHTHYAQPLTVSKLAEQSGVDENRLFYVFKKNAGIGPGDYLRRYRLNRARELLVTTQLSVAAVAEQVGYPDAFYFSRIFKKNFGIPPSKVNE